MMRAPGQLLAAFAATLVAATITGLAPPAPVPAPSAAASPVAGAGSVAFVHMGVLPIDRERLLTDQTVILEAGKIAALGPSDQIRVPEGATRIDGDNQLVLLPGLADMHVHLRYESDLLLLVANGVTTVRNMRGKPFHLELRRKVEDGSLLGPHIVTSGEQLRGGDVNARTPEEAVRLVDEQAAAGYDFIKVYDGLSKETYAAIVTEAKAKGLPVAGHVPSAVGVEGALAAQQASIEHAEQFVYHYFTDPRNPNSFDLDATRIPLIARRTFAAGAYVTPTLTIIENFIAQVEDRPQLFAEPELRYLHPETYAWWLTDEKVGSGLNKGIAFFQKQLVRGLRDAGVPLLAGTDFYAIGLLPGFGLHRELHSLVAAGLTPYEAISAATRNAARFLHREGHSGGVFVGADADLLVVRGNPLRDIAALEAIVGVALRGEWLPREELSSRLEAVARGFAPERGLVDTAFRQGGAAGATAARRGAAGAGAPFQESTFNLLGSYFLEKKKTADAIEIFKVVCEYYPRSADALDSLGDGYAAAGRVDEATASYQRALQINPGLTATREKLEKLHEKPRPPASSGGHLEHRPAAVE
jgi:imidazolonepropionase-like amidohydrolase